MNLHLDYETRSAADLKKVGSYAYFEHPTTEIICASYAPDDEPVRSRRSADFGELARLIPQAKTVTCHNAQFERLGTRAVGKKYGLPEIPIEKMRCTMVMAYAMGLPGALENAAPAAGLKHRKDNVGHRLMLKMCKPRPPRKNEAPGLYWHETPEEIERLMAYCAQDVEVERELEKRLLPLSADELQLWFLDQRINDRGVNVDVEIAEAAKRIVATVAERLNRRMFKVTGAAVRGVTDMTGLMAFCRARGLADLDSLAKDQLGALLARDDLPPDVREALEIRQEGAKASVAKINALLLGRQADGRARGFLQFHAAGTGRWAGRRFQPQNLKRPENKKLVDGVIKTILTGNADLLELCYGPPLSAIGDTIRGMVKAAPGADILAADYSNIEGRVLAWLAGEEWKLKAFREFDRGIGADLYKLAYARAFGVLVEAVTEELRQIGKVMELALGYAGGPGAFLVMAKGYSLDVGAYYEIILANAGGMGAKAEEAFDHRGKASGTARRTWVAAETLKMLWRAAHPAIVQFWADIERAAILAVETPGAVVVCGRLKFVLRGSFLFMRRPCGTAMAYPYPVVMDVPYFGKTKQALTYKTVPDPLKPGKIIPEADGSIDMKWARISTYGGMLAENATQATARDILGAGMLALDAAGYPIVLHVHDEPVAEVCKGFGSEEKFRRLMTTLPACYDGLPVAAGSFRAERYRK